MALESPPVKSAPASYARRAIAVVIDGGLTLGAAIAVYASGLEPATSFLSKGDGFLVFIPLNWALIGAAYSTVLHGRGRGQTLGKMIVGIRVIDAKTGGGIGLSRAFGRWFATALLWGFFPVSTGLPVLLVGGVVDSMWPLFDARRRALHDKVAGSVVCETVPARLPSSSIRFGDDAMGRPLSVRLVTAAAVVGLIFMLAAEALNPVLRIVLFLGVVLACVDAVSGRSLRTPSAGDRLPLLARLRSEFVADVVGEIGRIDRIGATDLRTRILSAAADGRLALFALLAGVLALYGHSSLLTTEKVENYRLVVALFGLALLAPLPGSMQGVALQLRARASAAAAAACFGSVVVLALGAHFVSLPMFVLGLALAATAARLTRDALPTRPASTSSAEASAVHV
jgi:uncharacterized RDD family membrane protein YckC